MTALSTERSLTRKFIGEPVPATLAFGVQAGAKIFKGSLVCLDAGFAKPGDLDTGLIAVGRAKKTVDNTTGDDGDLVIEVEQGAFLWENGDLTSADVGSDCYMTDDQTVQSSGSGASRAGTVLQIDDDGAWVLTVLGGQAAVGVVTLQSKTVQVTHADLNGTTADNTPQIVNIGTALPAGAVVLAHEFNVATLFSGGGVSAITMDIGGTDADAIVDGADIFTGAATGARTGTAGVHPSGSFSAQQLTATFITDAGHDLEDLTAGDLTITVSYVVP